MESNLGGFDGRFIGKTSCEAWDLNQILRGILALHLKIVINSSGPATPSRHVVGYFRSKVDLSKRRDGTAEDADWSL